MLAELAAKPSAERIANAGELLEAKQPDVPVIEKNSPDGLRLETQVWELEVARNPFGMTFSNKLTGAEWTLTGVHYETRAETPGQPSQGPAAGRAIRLRQVGKLRRMTEPGFWKASGRFNATRKDRDHGCVAKRPGRLDRSFKLGADTSSKYMLLLTARSSVWRTVQQAKLDNLRISLHPR